MNGQDEGQKKESQQQACCADKFFEEDAQADCKEQDTRQQHSKPRTWNEGGQHACKKINHKKVIQTKYPKRQSKQDPSNHG